MKSLARPAFRSLVAPATLGLSLLASAELRADGFQEVSLTGPSGRCYHTMTNVGGKLYLFAGQQQGGAALGDLFRYTDGATLFEPVTASGTVLSRQGHAAAESGGKVFVFQGFGSSGAARTDAAAFDTATNAWTAAGSLTNRSYFSASTMAATSILIFGGLKGSGATDELFSYDPTTNAFTPVTKEGDWPLARYGHTTHSYKGMLLLFGGNNFNGSRDNYLNDTWQYDPAQKKWTQLTTTNAPPVRALHSSELVGDKLIVFGGETPPSNAPIGDTWELDIPSRTWTRKTDMPIAVSGHSSTLLPATSGPARLLLFGGLLANNSRTNRSFVYTTDVSLAPAGNVVPIVLDVSSSGTRFTTELSLANAGTQSATATLTYTASLGSGSGSVNETVAAGRQTVIPDVIAYLRGKGLSIPTEGAQGGTLLVTSAGAPVAATARTAAATASPLPEGRAGLAYTALPESAASTSRVTVFGLRSNSSDRSNLAMFNVGSDPVTLKVTAHDGDTGQSTVVNEGLELPTYGWNQINRILEGPGYTNGYITVERTSSAGRFSAYGVANDNVTNDGSYVPATGATGSGSSLTVPVLVETSAFRSELILANRGTSTATFTLSYKESLSPQSGAGGTVTVTVGPGRQLLLAEAVDYLRNHGATLGALNAGSYAGALRVTVSGASLADAFAAARTAAVTTLPDGRSGQFGLFTPPVYGGQEASASATVYGLLADADNRTNVAVLHAGADGSGSITLRLQVIDGATGQPAGSALDVTLDPGSWSQPSGFFAASGATSGYVQVTRLSGTAPWVAYGVVNDGGAPGQRTGDGAYVPASY